MDEKELLKTGDAMSPEDATRPEPENEQKNTEISAEQREAQEKMENIFKSISALKPEEKETEEPIETDRNKETAEAEIPEETEAAEEPAEPEASAPAEIELMTVRSLTQEQKHAIERKKQAAKKQKNKRMMRKVLLALLVITVVIAGGGLYADYMPNKQSGEIVITVPEGAGTAEIAQILKRDNLIGSEIFYRVMSKVRGIDGKYNFGKFKLDKSAGYEDIFRALTQSGQNVNAVKVTIPEGYEIYKIADLLEEKGLIDQDKFYYLIDYGAFDYDFVQEIPQRENRLEGYLFPSTYEFVPNDEYGIIDAMLMQFEKVYGKYADRTSEIGMSMDEVITLASIIEREALGDEDRKLVSSVFHNRIKSREYPYLQSCATVQYVLKERKAVLSLEDTRIDSPYNTYINKGLPIGPIASPSEKAIEAALYPEESEYLFFVLGSDGKHHFSKTFDEHRQNKNN